ncbi:MAG: hypothetical protein M0R76_13900 [Proteobacteria bacterium]|nr:hypothetical protein [Pseudomonadota bacterium]
MNEQAHPHADTNSLSTSAFLQREQQATLDTPRYPYSFLAKVFFFGMDVLAGKKDDLPKAKLLEILASIPYRVWEIRHYVKQTRQYRNRDAVARAQDVISWGRDAQDNEYLHLQVIHEKMKADGIRDKWYLSAFVSGAAVLSYVLIARTMAFFSQRRAFLFNAEFENHAEGVYARLVVENPQWETQPVDNPIVKQYADVDTWADVFRRISLDERDHMNSSFAFCGKAEHIHRYEGMPPIPNHPSHLA